MAIIFDNVSFGYGDKPILQNVSFILPDSGCVCLFGPSGCGKTTLLRLLCGLERPQTGHIHGLDGQSTAIVFQEDRLLPWRSVLDNVRLAGAAVSIDRAAAWLETMGLTDVMHAFPGELSGGMNRRVAMARALAADADLLVLDEPFTGLDTARMADVAGIIRRAYADRPIVMVSHSLKEAEAMGARLCKLPDTPPLSGKIY